MDSFVLVGMETKDSHQSDQFLAVVIPTGEYYLTFNETFYKDPWKSSRPLKPNSPLELLMKYIPIQIMVFSERPFI